MKNPDFAKHKIGTAIMVVGVTVLAIVIIGMALEGCLDNVAKILSG